MVDVLIDLITCAAYPDITPSDALLARELATRGIDVRVRPWNPSGDESTEPGDIVVLRSSWDYHTAIQVYEAWLGATSTASVLVNSLGLVRWGLRKDYLLELGEKGAPIPATTVVHPSDARPPSWVAADREVVVQPLIGASGVGVERCAFADVGGRLAEATAAHGPVMVQEFVRDLGGGEWALDFFDGTFSHAFQRVPAAGEFRVNSGFGGSVRAGRPPGELLSIAHQVVGLLPEVSTYARVDLVMSPRGPVLMEVEVNEPSLCLHLEAGAPGAFADAVLAAAD